MPLAASIISASGIRLFPIEEARSSTTWLGEGFSPVDSEKIAECADWTAIYPQQRVKKYRRFEPLCPMVAPSISANGMYVAAVDLEEREPALSDLDGLLMKAGVSFTESIQIEDPRLKCLILMLPGVKGQRLLDATDPGRNVKNDLLKQGVLVGEFFPTCPFATTFNPRLFALRSPVPMYVLRSFIETDWRFICQVPEWQKTYRERFGDPPPKLRHIGGFWWRMRQKLFWKWDALANRLLPGHRKESRSNEGGTR